MGIRHLPDLVVATVSLAAAMAIWVGSASWSAKSRRFVRSAVLLAYFIVLLGSAMGIIRFGQLFPVPVFLFTRGAAVALAGMLIYSCVIIVVLRQAQRFSPLRREWLQGAAQVAMAVPVVVGATAYLKRDDLRINEINVCVPNLPKDLQGLRIVQLSDLHLSPLVSERTVARAIDMANETSAQVAVITGDLISMSGDPLDACLAQIARLRSDAGIYGCMGNHEEYAEALEYTTQAGANLGIRFLRDEFTLLRFGSANLNLAGVDYQSRQRPYLVGTEELLVSNATNVLLSHNPDVFPVAAEQGWDLTLAGHTHGGQINFEMIHPSINVVRLLTPYVHGLYKQGNSSVFVTRGIGTIGLPARLGAPPEVSLIRLCGISS